MNKKNIFFIVLAFIALMMIGSASAGIFDFLGGGSDTIRIGYIPSDHDAALYVADAKGYFEDEGLKVDLIKFNNGNELMKAMDNDEIDVGYVGVAAALYSIGNGGSSKIISSAQNEGSGIVVSEDSGISQASDLKNKSIAVSGKGSLQELLLLNYLKNNGLSLKDLNTSYFSAPSVNTALKNSKIDGAVTFQPYVSMAESNGSVALANSSEIMPNHPCCVVVASGKFIKDHNDVVEKVVSIHKKATDFINDNIAQGKTSDIVDLLPNEIVSNRDLEVNSLESFPFTADKGSNFKSNVLTLQQLESDIGAIKYPVSEDQIFWEA